MLRAVVPLLLVAATPALAQPAGAPSGPWQTFLQGGGVQQFETGLEGGEVSVDRLFIEGGIAYAFDRRRSVGLAVGYGYDAYDFSGGDGFGALDPWDTINEYRLSAPIRWGFGERVDAFAAPTVRWTAESGADLGDALTAGFNAGFTYAVNDRLRVGPGVGVFSQLEDDASVFPILFIDWQVTDTIRVATGGGLGATRGPGLTIAYSGIEDWTFTLGARREDFRFRLDDDDIAPDGVGIEEAVPIFLSAGYDILPTVRLSAIGGVDVAGEMTIEDSEGREVTASEFDPAPFLGFTFRARF